MRATRIALVLLPVLVAGAGQATGSDAKDGEYLFNAAGCLGCHTREDGPPLAGGRPLETPFGIFYAPNITPDPETGIGNWSREDFIDAVRHGVDPDGMPYYPAFPYASYRLMSDADAGAIFDYLRTRKPVQEANREHDLKWWLQSRLPLWGWQWLFLPDARDPLDDLQLERGRYLTDALGHCGECHTPRGWFGQMLMERYLAGAAAQGPDGEAMPNITPDRESGLGKWSADDIEYLLETGELPDGDYIGGHMAEVVDNGTAQMTTADRRAIVKWLRSIPPAPGKPASSGN